MPIAGGLAVPVGATPTAGGDVEDFEISPTSGQLVYRADHETDEVFELYAVPVQGGPAIKLNAPLATDEGTGGDGAQSRARAVPARQR